MIPQMQMARGRAAEPFMAALIAEQARGVKPFTQRHNSVRKVAPRVSLKPEGPERTYNAPESSQATRESPMLNRRNLLLGGGAVAVLGAAGFAASRLVNSTQAKEQFAVSFSEAEWKERLTPEQFAVLREEGTEPPWSSPLNKEKRKGVYHCAGCDQALYSSETKYESGTGWPSFYAPIEGGVATSTDYKLIYPRTEVHCARCGGHLGHVFDDGPPPTGLRYCMNGVALAFKPAATA
jgi:peptide-methionine (R)-S-oxide reductase